MARGPAVGHLRGVAGGDRPVLAEGGLRARRAAPARCPSGSPRPAARSGSGTISSASRPSAVAAAARSWERSASMSCAARVTSRRTFSASDSSPIPTSPIEQYRPSWTMRSRIGGSFGGRARRTRVRRAAHGVEAADEHVSASPSRTIAGRERDRRHAREADVVDRRCPASSGRRRRGSPPGARGSGRCAACRTLPREDVVGNQAGAAREGLADGVGAEVDGVDLRERAPVAPDRRAGAVDEDRGGVVLPLPRSPRRMLSADDGGVRSPGRRVGQQMQGVSRPARPRRRPPGRPGRGAERRLAPGARRDADRDPADGRRDDAVDVPADDPQHVAAPSARPASAAVSAAGRPIVSNSAIPVGMGGWCIATIVGEPSSASGEPRAALRVEAPAVGVRGTSVSHMSRRTPPQSTAYCTSPSVDATPGWSANASRRASRSSWLPGMGWTGTPSGASSSRTRA